MSDSIYREDVLAFLRRWHEVKDYSYGEKNIIGAAIQEVENLPPCPSWMPCSERLPDKKRETYWVCTDTGYQCQCRWTNNPFGIGESDEWTWSIFDTPQYTKVIAWMPLPEPYKPKEC